MLAPICLFTYNRLEETIKTVNALKENFLADKSDLIIFSDAAKNNQSTEVVQNVRNYLKTISGFKSIEIIESIENKGLAESIIQGVTKVITEYGRVIVLEDDLVTSKNFLVYMNEALTYFRESNNVFSIAGYTPPICSRGDDIYFTKRASSWGWATWKDRWVNISWDLNEYFNYINTSNFKAGFNMMGSDMFKMLGDQISGKINSWAIRWCLYQYLNNLYTVYPTLSKVQNIGNGSDASHTKDNFNRFYTPLDTLDNSNFSFDRKVELESYYLKQFLNQFSLYNRIKYKLLNKILS